MYEKDIKEAIGQDKQVWCESWSDGEVFEPNLMSLLADLTSHNGLTQDQAIESIKNATIDNPSKCEHFRYSYWSETK